MRLERHDAPPTADRTSQRRAAGELLGGHDLVEFRHRFLVAPADGAAMMNAHFAAAVPDLRAMEIDIDRLPRDEEVFTAVPQFDNGHLLGADYARLGICRLGNYYIDK